MIEIKARAPDEGAMKLAAKGGVKATVRGRRAIVFAQAWGPITEGVRTDPYVITARTIRSDARDIEAEGTPDADAETQQLIDSMIWEEWRYNPRGAPRLNNGGLMVRVE